MSRIPRSAALAMALMALLATALLPLGAEAAAEGRGFAAHLRAFGLIGRRSEGSLAEREALAYIKDRAAALGIPTRTIPLDRLEDAHSYSSILTLSIPGPGRDLLVFIVPLDCHADAPSGEGDAGLALALAEIETLAAERKSGKGPALSVDFVFLGAERRGRVGEGVTSGPGARWWIDNLDESRATAVVYLSLDALPGSLVLRNAIAGTLSPYWLYERMRLALAASGFDYRLEPNRMQGYRLGLLENPGPLQPFLGSGIPALELRSEGAKVVLADPSLPFALLVRRLTEAGAGPFLDTWDRDYSTFQLGTFSFVVKEGPFVVFLLCFVALAGALLFVLSISRREVLLRFAAKLPRRLAYVGALALVAVFALLSMRLGLLVESGLLGTIEAWRGHPG